MPESDDELVRELADGWTIHVRGDWQDDGGWSGGHVSGSVGYLGLPDADAQGMIAELDARRADDLRAAVTPRSLLVRLTRDGLDVTVFDEARLPADGPAMLLWPPTVVPEGVVLRWTRETTLYERADGQPTGRGQAPRQTASAPQAGLLVTAEGEVRRLPFELNVSPVAVAPDGRLLIPSQDPLWWDDGDASLTLLSLDGSTEPLLVDGAPVTPSRLLDAIGEPQRNHAEGAKDAPHWTLRQARFDGDELLLRLEHDASRRDPELDHDREWVSVAVRLSGRWSVRRTGTGTLLRDEPLPPL